MAYYQLMDGFSLTDAGISLFSEYSKMDIGQVIQRAQHIQKKALQIHHYRFIEFFRFLHPRISSNPFLNSMLPLKGPFLDIGCAFGTDLRYLTTKGANPENLYGHDIHDGFISLGRELFYSNYSRTMENKLHFLIGSLTDSQLIHVQNGNSAKVSLNSFYSFFYACHAGSVLHLLSLNENLALVQKIFEILQPNGYFIGRTAGTLDSSPPPSTLKTIHTPDSLKSILKNIGFNPVKISIDDRETLKKKTDTTTYPTLHFIAQKPAS